MSSYFLIFFLISCFFLILSIYFDGNRIRSMGLFTLFWVFPTLLSQITSFEMNKEWGLLVLSMVFLSFFGFLVGYLISYFFQKRESGLPVLPLHYYLLIANLYHAIAILALIYIFYSLGSFPLFSDNISKARIELPVLNSYLWSLVQLSIMAASLLSFSYINGLFSRVSMVLSVIMVILITLTAWRNVLTSYLIFFITPILFHFSARASTFLKYLIVVVMFLLFLGYIRGDMGSNPTIASALSMVANYVYPNFLNLQEITTSQNIESDHMYTVQFLLKPILYMLDYSLEPVQTAIGGYNVSTGLSPLYLDGGLLNIFLVFFVIGFFLKRLDYTPSFRFPSVYWRSVLVATIFYMHNGWFLLNYTVTYNFISFVLIYFLCYCLSYRLRV